jgi:uncharacterized membrane protein YdjX (TVP38/TMEM64 family)
MSMSSGPPKPPPQGRPQQPGPPPGKPGQPRPGSGIRPGNAPRSGSPSPGKPPQPQRPPQQSNPPGPAKPTPARRSAGPLPQYRTGPLPADMPIFDPTQPSFWQRIKYPLRWFLIAGFLIAGIVLFKRYELGSYLNQEQIQALLEPFGPWAPAAFIGIFVLAIVLMIPYSVMAGLGALFFGLAWGTLWNVLGGTLGALVVYALSRLLGQSVIRKQAGNQRWENLNRRLEKDGFYYLLLVRTLAILPFNLLNFACAFTAIKLRHFILANLVGLILPGLVYGYSAKILLDPATSKTQLAWLVGIVLLVVVPPIIFRQARRSRRKEQKSRIEKAFHFPGE